MAKDNQNRWQQIAATVIATLVVIILICYFWCSQVYLKPQNVFWGMINQDLQTTAVTKTTSQTSSNQNFMQVTDLQFKDKLVAHTTVTIKDKTPGKSSSIITETFGTPTQDYLRYNEIKLTTSNPSKNAVGVWAATKTSTNQPGQILSSALLSSPMIFGYLNANQRADIIRQLHDHNVFNINFAATNTNEKVNGKKAYAYKITINVANYLQVFRALLAMIDQQNLALQIGQPNEGTVYKATLLVNPISRQPLRLTPDGSTVSEQYSNFDIAAQLQLPTHVKLSILQLQQRLVKQAN